jgi:Family of unknown function (DUF5317)
MLLLYAIAIGLLVGRLAGGRVRNLERVQLAWWGLALGGLVVQLVLFAPPVADRIGAAGPAIYVISTLAVLAALMRNLELPGFTLIAIGAVANLIAILANGGAMPSDPSAWLALTGKAELPVSGFSNSVLIGPQTNFPFLGDVFVLPRSWPLANVFSIGDVLIGIGAAWFLIRAMRETTGSRVHDQLPAPTTASR